MAKLIPKFYGKVQDGKLFFDKRGYFDNYLKQLKGNVEIIVRKCRKTRSTRQNSYYWVYITLIADETGELEPMQLHEMFKRAFLTEVINFKGKEFKITGSTAKLDSLRFSEYMDKIEKVTGIPCPDPNDFYIG